MASGGQTSKPRAFATVCLRTTLTSVSLALTIILSGTLVGSHAAHATAPSSSLSFESPLNISMNDGNAYRFTLADAHENVYLAWQDQTPGIESVFFGRSEDRGESFAEPVNMSIDNDGPSFSHDMVASGDRVFIVWSQLPGPFNTTTTTTTTTGNDTGFEGQTLYLRKSTDNGETFGAPITVSPPGYDASNPKIAVSGRNVYVGWEGTIPDVDSTVHIFFAKSTDGGKSFSAPLDFGPSVNPRLAVDQNNVYLAWDGGDDLMFTRSTDYGASFDDAINLSDNPGYSAWSTIMVAPRTGYVYVTWMDVATGFTDVYFRRSIDNGSNFEPIVNVSDNEWESGIPDMAVHGNNVYIVWSEERNSNFEVILSRSKDGGVSFEQPINISKNPQTSWEATVAAYREKVFVGWVNYSDDGSSFDTFVAKSSNWGGRFGSSTNLSSNDGDSMFINSAISRGHYYIGWTDDSLGNFDLFFSRAKDDESASPSPSFPTIPRSKVDYLTKDAVPSSEYGLTVKFVHSKDGFDTIGVTPVGGDGQLPDPESNGLIMYSTTDLWFDRVLICGPDGICIECDCGGLISGVENQSFTFFYPMNEVNWNVGDPVSMWLLVAKVGTDYRPEETKQWMGTGEQLIEECESDLWC